MGDFSALQATHSRQGQRLQEIQGPDLEDVKPEDLDIAAAESENIVGGLQSKQAKAVATACASAGSGDSGQHDVQQTRTCSNLSSSPRDLEQKDEDASMIYATRVCTGHKYKSSSCEAS